MSGIVALVFGVLVMLAGPGAASPDFAGPLRVVDGDTIDVGATRVRLFGIDAPENDQTCQTEQGVVWRCGAWVSAQLRQGYEGRVVHCEAIETDRYGRVVARCRASGRDIGRDMVAEGLAFAYRKYARDYVADEQRAARRDMGLHASRVQMPGQFRKTRAIGMLPPDRNCRIKGNISRNGTKIYHRPGQRDYERTGIRPESGERWFCSTAEAEASGWRAAKR